MGTLRGSGARWRRTGSEARKKDVADHEVSSKPGVAPAPTTKPATAADLGIRRDEIHEARERNVSAHRDPGMIRPPGNFRFPISSEVEDRKRPTGKSPLSAAPATAFDRPVTPTLTKLDRTTLRAGGNDGRSSDVRCLARSAAPHCAAVRIMRRRSSRPPSEAAS
ncbi:hypothetical protein RSP03_24200 [Cereibacter sphaeroides]|nr:hypothetical protein RSP03_24200 [Cereibacter sphaeroides]